MSTISAIDVGSNAMRLVLAQVDQKNNLTILENFREAVRLGEDVFNNGHIAEKTIEASIDALQRFARYIREHGATRVKAVGTSALREAENSARFIEIIKERTGLLIEIISAEQEARLIQMAVSSKMDMKDKRAMLIDIGGGSVELSLVEDAELVNTLSAKIGTVRLLTLLQTHNQSPRRFRRLADEYLQSLHEDIAREFRLKNLDLCVGTGGNIEALGSLRVSLLGKNNDRQLSLRELEQIVSKLEDLNVEERARELGLRPDRADVILPAALVLKHVLQSVRLPGLSIPRVGLKEGLLLDITQALPGGSIKTRRRALLDVATELARKYQVDLDHAQTVEHYGAELFEGLKEVHKLDESIKLSIELAATLHETGLFIGSKGYHKHSAYLVRASSQLGISAKQREFLACLVRYHRRSFPRDNHPEFSMMPPEDRGNLLKACCLLRLADALAGEHRNRIEGFTLTVKDKCVAIEMEGEGDFLLENWLISQLAPYFKKIFGYELKVTSGV